MIQRRTTKPLVRREPVVQKREYKQTGLYQKLDINQLDGRTGIAKTIRALTSELENYVGEITAPAQMLIQRIVYKHLRLSQYENSTIEDPKNVEAQHYIPLANSLRLDLLSLKEMAAQKAPQPDLQGYIKGNYKVGGDE